MKIGALVLAAGSSQRFGTDKRTTQLRNGNLMVIETLQKIVSNFEETAIVLKESDDEVEKLIKENYLEPEPFVYRATESHQGIGNSLSSSISVSIDRQWSGTFIFLADMPFIKSETIAILKEEALINNRSIIIPEFESFRGHPVFFPSRFYQELGLLKGDQGAKKIIESNLESVKQVEVADEGITKDIDCPEDLE